MKSKIVTFIIILIGAIAVTLFILFGNNTNIDDIKKDVDKIIEEKEFEDIYEINVIDIGENELGADASLYDSVESFDAGSAYSWKKKDSLDAGYIYVYQIKDDNERADFVKEVKAGESTPFIIREDLVCEKGNTVIFATNPISYEEGMSVSEEVIENFCFN